MRHKPLVNQILLIILIICLCDFSIDGRFDILHFLLITFYKILHSHTNIWFLNINTFILLEPNILINIKTSSLLFLFTFLSLIIITIKRFSIVSIPIENLESLSFHLISITFSRAITVIP